ncbi:MAG: GLPGLI family protein [Bacteroidota bacterium]|nr:GLPGLI family protein [Bacteroidota bacterium]
MKVTATKHPLLLVIVGLVSTAPTLAQTSGRIQYEVTKRVDPSTIRVVINGEVVKPGSPNFPTDIPDTRTTGMTLAYAGNYAKETRESGALRTTTMAMNGGTGVPQTSLLKAPFEETTYVDLPGRAVATVLTVTKDNATSAYRSNAPFVAPTGWTLTNQTRKIAGYRCRKATAPYQQETYTIWFTTDLPFTYSPVRELMPEKGVVLQLEGEKEQYQATKVDLKAVADTEVRPLETAQTVTPAELKDLREKARADFRQRLIDGESK